VQDDVDLRFHDRVALEEIELYTEVLSAVAAADRSLTVDEIDEVLGLRQRAGAEARSNWAS
jgi:hypothetical protein